VRSFLIGDDRGVALRAQKAHVGGLGTRSKGALTSTSGASPVAGARPSLASAADERPAALERIEIRRLHSLSWRSGSGPPPGRRSRAARRWR
jgi:hypothetical protein